VRVPEYSAKDARRSTTRRKKMWLACTADRWPQINSSH